MEDSSKIKQVDLESLEAEFKAWLSAGAREASENESLALELGIARRQLEFSQAAAKSANETTNELRAQIARLHDAIARSFDRDEENRRLRERIDALARQIATLERDGRAERESASTTLANARRAHADEIRTLRDELTRDAERATNRLERVVRERSGEVRDLRRDLETIEKRHHDEILKVRLDCDGKLLKLQKTFDRRRDVDEPDSVVGWQRRIRGSEEVIGALRREIATLKDTVAELERAKGGSSSLASSRSKRGRLGLL